MSIQVSIDNSIVHGERRTIRFSITDSETGLPKYLSGFIGATAYFPKSDGTVLSATGSLASAPQGLIDVPVNEVETASLLETEEGDYEIEIDRTSERVILQVLGRLKVSKRLFE